MLSRLTSRLRSPFRPLYDEARFSPVMRFSVMMVFFANMCGNLFGTITGGTALTGYAKALGANDFVFGLLTGIPFAATIIQIPASILVSRTHKRKKYILTYGIFSRALWIVVGIVPYIIPMTPLWIKLWTVIFLIGISSASSSFINVCFTPWLADLVPPGIRGRWLSIRDGINSIIGVAVGLLTAYILDHVTGNAGYAIVFIIGGTFGVIDMLCFWPVQEVYSEPPVRVRILPVIRQIFADKPFFRFMLFWAAWNFTANISGPFLARYALGPMGLSYMDLTIYGQIAAALTTFLVISRWGRLIDRYGSKPVLWISCIVASLTPGFFCFSVPGSIWPLLLHNVIGAAFWSAANVVAATMQLSYSPNDLRPTYVAVFSCFCSLAGAFLGVLFGGALLEWLNALISSGSFHPFGTTPDHYKIVFALSVVLRFGIVLLFVPAIKNEREFTVKTMLGDILKTR